MPEAALQVSANSPCNGQQFLFCASFLFAPGCACHCVAEDGLCCVQIAIEPKSKADNDKMGMALYKLAQEDPSFHFSRDDETNQTVIEGMGELHLDIIVDRMKREFNVAADIGAPQVTSPLGPDCALVCTACEDDNAHFGLHLCSSQPHSLQP